jgi:sialic acid synthase SpsE
MSEIILDMGSGNTCKNKVDIAKLMIDTVAQMDSHKHKIIFKWQLEMEVAPPNRILDRDVFEAAYYYAKSKGYPTTSSVFDYPSLQYLLKYEIPFVKIACQPDKYWLAGKVPREVPIVLSHDFRGPPHDIFVGTIVMQCVPEYPAKLSDYNQGNGVFSDHTPGLELWNYYHPGVWEKHFVLEREPDNPDSGIFALTPDQLMEVIG